MSRRKCKVCRGWYSHPAKDVPQPQNSTIQHQVCSIQCLSKLALQLREKQQKKAIAAQRKKEREWRSMNAKTKRAAREADKGWWRKKSLDKFQEWVKLNEPNDPCWSCGKYNVIQFHAGHYIPVGRSDALMFEPDNCHKQCSQCNSQLSGNLTEYRKTLVKKIGVERVEWLEGKHENPRYRVADYKEIYAKYKAKADKLQAEISKDI